LLVVLLVVVCGVWYVGGWVFWLFVVGCLVLVGLGLWGVLLVGGFG
jgi:hypothetical protein